MCEWGREGGVMSVCACSCVKAFTATTFQGHFTRFFSLEGQENTSPPKPFDVAIQTLQMHRSHNVEGNRQHLM